MSRDQLTNWYATLSPRDQRVLLLGAVVVVGVLLAGTFLSLHRKLDEASTQRDKQQADLEWMRSVGPLLASAGPGPVAVTTPQSLLVLIDSSAGESGLRQALTGTQPGTNGSMRVEFEQADFNMLAAWMSRLSSQHGVRVESASITAGNTPGIVNATVQLHAR